MSRLVNIAERPGILHYAVSLPLREILFRKLILANVDEVVARVLPQATFYLSTP